MTDDNPKPKKPRAPRKSRAKVKPDLIDGTTGRREVSQAFGYLLRTVSRIALDDWMDNRITTFAERVLTAPLNRKARRRV